MSAETPGTTDSRPEPEPPPIEPPQSAARDTRKPAPDTRPSLTRWAPAAALAGAAAFVLAGLSGFGIWDPWEIEVADAARRLADGKSVNIPHVGSWLVSRGFGLFGVDEWSGRLPIALSGIAAVALTYALVARFAGRRAGMYALLIACTSPLFLFNTRTMLGEAPTFALQAALALCAFLALFGGQAQGAPGTRARLGWLVAALVVSVLNVLGRGALLGALPPLCAAVLAAGFEGKLAQRRTDPVGFAATLVLGALAATMLIAVTHAVLLDSAGFSIWLGGAPQGGQPPSFEGVIERVFHAFAPWSALLPLALARIGLAGGSEAESDEAAASERQLGLLCVLWLALSYGVLVLFLSRYGDRAGAFPLAALAASVALFLRGVERSRSSQWPAAIAAGLLAVLIVRDYALYPSGPVHGMPLSDFTVPEVFNPRLAWALVLSLFGASVVYGLGVYAPAGPGRLELRAPYRLIAAQWRRGLGFKLWLLLFAAALVGLLLFGVWAFVLPKLGPLSTQAVKWGKRLLLVPPALPLAVAALQVLAHLCAKLRDRRTLPILIAGAVVGAYASFGFMPALSSHFSPREVYETYNELAAKGEPLVEYKVGTRAAAYYAKGTAIEVDGLTKLMEPLLAQKRCWVVFPSEELAPIDRMFRAKTGRHLFVADARSAKVTLATNQKVAGRSDESFLARYVKREPPPIQTLVKANFDDKIELLGYDLKLPHGDHVGAGESFELTWYFKALRQVPGSYRIFVHIDASSMRIHGDHDPLDGRYPVRLWDPGDVIVDQQRIEVPPNYPAGPYTILMGFYSGETRLKVKDGPHDDADRVRAGVLRIR